VARVVAFIPDLLFGSNVLGALRAAGHEVQLTADPSGASGDVMIVDLTADSQQRIDAVREISLPKLAFYSHVETDVRDSAREAGFDLVVPRSRMAREAGALVSRLAPSAAD
jgi:hypothetical protein